MPNQVVPKGNDGDDYSWLHIDDFTPGLFTANATGVSALAGLTNYTPQPLGSASDVEACIGQPNGGLVPLPWFPETPRPWPYGTISGPFFVTGVETNTARRINYLMAGDTEETELICMVEVDDGTTHLVAVNSYVVETAVVHAILHSTSASTGQFWGTPYPQWTRMSEDGDIFSPVLVFPSIVPTDSQGENGHMYVYPDLTAPTAFGIEDIVAESAEGATGQLITYDGRIMGLVTQDYAWPGTDTPTFRSNESIEYTDPPESNAYFPTGAEYALLVPENPYGYGAVGSISAGELFLVKRRGGGVLVLGDIDAPSSVTYLPGVQPTGNFFGHGDSSQLGFVYCAQGAGAWVWNGANVSQKFSSQLEDDFFDALTPSGFYSENYGFFVKRWGNYVLFSNNYIYNILTQSWWRFTFPDDPDFTYYHYVDARDDHQIYAMPLHVDPTHTTFLYIFDTRTGAPHYRWVSTDLYRQVSSIMDRRVDIRSIDISCSVAVPADGYTVTVSILGDNDTVVATQTSNREIGSNPTLIRFNFGAKGLQNFKIKLESDSPHTTPGSSTAAPTIWGMDVAYRVRNTQGIEQ